MNRSNGKLYRYGGALWSLFQKSIVHNNEPRLGIAGPFCLDCHTQLLTFSTESNDAVCPNDVCGKKHQLTKASHDLKPIIRLIYEGKAREGFEVVALDLPRGRVVDKKEDEDYWVDARLGQHKGKKTAMILFGDKSRRNEGKAQVFIDLEDEQVRFHANDAHPVDVACKVEIEFSKSKQIIKKK